jgi:hypothetical protein
VIAVGAMQDALQFVEAAARCPSAQFFGQGTQVGRQDGNPGR